MLIHIVHNIIVIFLIFINNYDEALVCDSLDGDDLANFRSEMNSRYHIGSWWQ